MGESSSSSSRYIGNSSSERPNLSLTIPISVQGQNQDALFLLALCPTSAESSPSSPKCRSDILPLDQLLPLFAILSSYPDEYLEIIEQCLPDLFTLGCLYTEFYIQAALNLASENLPHIISPVIPARPLEQRESSSDSWQTNRAPESLPYFFGSHKESLLPCSEWSDPWVSMGSPHGPCQLSQVSPKTISEAPSMLPTGHENSPFAFNQEASASSSKGKDRDLDLCRELPSRSSPRISHLAVDRETTPFLKKGKGPDLDLDQRLASQPEPLEPQEIFPVLPKLVIITGTDFSLDSSSELDASFLQRFTVESFPASASSSSPDQAFFPAPLSQDGQTEDEIRLVAPPSASGSLSSDQTLYSVEEELRTLLTDFSRPASGSSSVRSASASEADSFLDRPVSPEDFSLPLSLRGGFLDEDPVIGVGPLMQFVRLLHISHPDLHETLDSIIPNLFDDFGGHEEEEEEPRTYSDEEISAAITLYQFHSRVDSRPSPPASVVQEGPLISLFRFLHTRSPDHQTFVNGLLPGVFNPFTGELTGRYTEEDIASAITYSTLQWPAGSPRPANEDQQLHLSEPTATTRSPCYTDQTFNAARILMQMRGSYSNEAQQPFNSESTDDLYLLPIAP